MTPNYKYLESTPDDYYVKNGYVHDNQMDAFVVAMGSYYSKGYYNVKLSNNQTYNVKNVDTKADIHTNTANCYTLADNSIVEVATYGVTDYSYLGNSLVKGIYVTEIIQL